MLAKSQKFNDNVGNENTELCFCCIKYKTKDEFNTDEGKHICKECYKKFEELCKKFNVKFIKKDRKARSLFYQEYIISDTYAMVNGKELFIRGHKKYKTDAYDFIDNEKAEVFNLKIQFLKTNLRYVTFYCGAWLDGLKRKEKISPLQFIDWIKDNGYNFGKHYDCRVENLDWGFWEFSGNLDNVSCAFCFRIFDKRYHKEVISKLNDTYFKNINLNKEK